VLQDKSSDDWWCTLESGEAVLKDADFDETIESGLNDLL
jgi:hypothetical protein